MDIPYDVEGFLDEIAEKIPNELHGPHDLGRLSTFLKENLPAGVSKYTSWFFMHPVEASRCLDLCEWAIDQKLAPPITKECATRLRCILAILQARDLHLTDAHHQLLLAAGVKEEEAEKVPFPDYSFLRTLLKQEPVTTGALRALFQAYFQAMGQDVAALRRIAGLVEEILFTVSEDEKVPGVVKAMFVVGGGQQGRLRNVLVRIRELPESTEPEMVYSSLARERVQPSLDHAAHVAMEVADAFLKDSGFEEGLSGRRIEWQIVLPTQKVDESEVTYDGESLGLPLAVAIVSAYLNEPIPADIALTGAFDLHGVQRGSVLGVGGISAKVEAALGAGIRKLYLPAVNEPDVSLAAEKEMQRLDAKVVPVLTLREACDDWLSSIPKGPGPDLSRLLFRSLGSLWPSVQPVQNNPVHLTQSRQHLVWASGLYTALYAIEALGSYGMFPGHVSPFAAMGTIVTMVALIFGSTWWALNLVHPFLQARNVQSWLAAVWIMSLATSLACLLNAQLQPPGGVDLTEIYDLPPRVGTYKDLTIFWMFGVLYTANLYHYVAGIESLLDRRQFFTAREVLRGQGEGKHPIRLLRIPWEAAVLAAAIVALFLLVFEIQYLNAIREGQPYSSVLAAMVIARDLTFIIAAAEVLVWYRMAQRHLEKRLAAHHILV